MEKKELPKRKNQLEKSLEDIKKPVSGIVEKYFNTARQ